MGRAIAFRLTQGLYYLALGTWFGALVMLVIAAATTFQTVESFHLAHAQGDATPAEPLLPGETARMLAGSIVGQAIGALTWVQGFCAGVAVLCLALQWTVFRARLVRGGRSRVNLLRTLLVVGPVLVLLLNVLWINPSVWESRAVMYDANRSADARQTARASFDRHHALSERTTGSAALMLAAAVLVSPFAFRVTSAPAVVERAMRAGAADEPRREEVEYE